METLIWIVTGACNLKCPYCYAYRYVNEKPLEIKKAYRILDEAVELGVSYINFTGGEPLLYRDLQSILKYSMELGIETSVFSNLTLMNDKWAEIISRYSGYILTSLDGPREIYERVKGPGTWDRFINGLNIVKKHNIEIHVNIPISRINYRVAGQAVEKAIELGIESISVIPAMASGRAVETNTFVGREEFLYALKQVDEVAGKYGLKIPVWCVSFLVALREFKNLVYGNCRYWKVLDLTPSGKVILCDVVGVVLADAAKEGLIKAWERVRDHPMVKRIWEKPSECLGCKYINYCLGGCYARALIYWGKLPAPDPLCPFVKLEDENRGDG